MPSPGLAKIPPLCNFFQVPVFFLCFTLALKPGELSYSEQLPGEYRWFCMVARWKNLWHKFIVISWVCQKSGGYPLLYMRSISPTCFSFLPLIHLQESSWVNSYVSWSIISHLFLETTYCFFCLFLGTFHI